MKKTIEIKAMNESEMRWEENGLKKLGFTKTNDCMWAKIYTKGNIEYIITREF